MNNLELEIKHVLISQNIKKIEKIEKKKSQSIIHHQPKITTTTVYL